MIRIFIKYKVVFITMLIFVILIIFFNKITKKFNYNKDVKQMQILDSKLPLDSKMIIIYNKEDITNFINFVNTLKLVNKKMPNLEDFENNGHVYIYLFGEEDILDTFLFSTHYFEVFHNGEDWNSTEYFILNSGYNSKDKSNKITKYLEEHGLIPK